MNQERHKRQIALPQIGQRGQEKINESKVLVIGAGGLANALVPYLASSGLGKIGIVDGDKVSESNLHRQIKFSPNDIGKYKAKTLAHKVQNQFVGVHCVAYNYYLSQSNILDLFNQYDFVVDASDEITIRYLINDASVLCNLPWVHAAVFRFQFQVACFNYKGSGSYRCLYPNKPQSKMSCEQAGVMPSTVALAGLYQANETLKLILGLEEPLINRCLLVDTLKNTHDHFVYTEKPKTIDEDQFKFDHKVQYINWLDAQNKQGLFFDVRELEEKPFLNFHNCIQIPLSQINEKTPIIEKHEHVFVFCQSGKRSAQAANILAKNNSNIYILTDNAKDIKSHLNTYE